MLERIKGPNDIHKIPKDKLYVLANEIKYDAAVGFTKDWDLNGEKTVLGVEKIS